MTAIHQGPGCPGRRRAYDRPAGPLRGGRRRTRRDPPGAPGQARGSQARLHPIWLCTAHVPAMSAATIRQIHAILSGAFATAVRWEWIDRNPAGDSEAAEGQA